MRFARLIGAATAATLACAALVACSAASEPQEDSVLRVAWAAPSISFSPDQGVDFSAAIGAVYDSLLSFPGEGTGIQGDGLEPWIATDWSYNEGNTVLTLTLLDDVFFTDGSPLDADAIKANLEYQQRPESIQAVNLALIEDIVVTDDHTLELRLSKPDPQLLYIIAGTGIASPAALKDPEKLATTPVGSGPYLLDEFTTDSVYTFVRNPDYWNPDAFGFDRIEVTLMPDFTAHVNALKSGQIDMTWAADALTAPELEAAGFATIATTTVWIGLVFGDRAGAISPPIGDLRVRQAISMAMDREGFAEAFHGKYGNPSNQTGVEGQGNFYLPERADEYGYDLEGAKALLAEAGYPDGFDIDIPYYDPEYQPYYVQAFEDLGIRVNWIQMRDDTWLQEFTSGKYAVIPVGGYVYDLTFVTPDGLWNPWHNSDAETVAILDAIATGTAEEADEAIRQLSEKVLDEAWYAILTHVPNITAYDDSVLELTPSGIGIPPLRNIQPVD